MASRSDRRSSIFSSKRAFSIARLLISRRNPDVSRSTFSFSSRIFFANSIVRYILSSRCENFSIPDKPFIKGSPKVMLRGLSKRLCLLFKKTSSKCPHKLLNSLFYPKIVLDRSHDPSVYGLDLDLDQCSFVASILKSDRYRP